MNITIKNQNYGVIEVFKVLLINSIIALNDLNCPEHLKLTSPDGLAWLGTSDPALSLDADIGLLTSLLGDALGFVMAPF